MDRDHVQATSRSGARIYYLLHKQQPNKLRLTNEWTKGLNGILVGLLLGNVVFSFLELALILTKVLRLLHPPSARQGRVHLNFPTTHSSSLPPRQLLHPLHSSKRNISSFSPLSEKSTFRLTIYPLTFQWEKKMFLGFLEINIVLLIDPFFPGM